MMAGAHQSNTRASGAVTGATFIVGPDGAATAPQLDYFAGNK